MGACQWQALRCPERATPRAACDGARDATFTPCGRPAADAGQAVQAGAEQRVRRLWLPDRLGTLPGANQGELRAFSATDVKRPPDRKATSSPMKSASG